MTWVAMPHGSAPGLQPSVLVVSHDLAVVRSVSDTVAVMARGRPVEQLLAVIDAQVAS